MDCHQGVEIVVKSSKEQSVMDCVCRNDNVIFLIFTLLEIKTSFATYLVSARSLRKRVFRISPLYSQSIDRLTERLCTALELPKRERSPTLLYRM